MKIAFYAPMKSPESERPSGDRTIGRLLMAALARAGADVRLASDLRTWSVRPSDSQLMAFKAAASAETSKLLSRYNSSVDNWKPDAWFTYHSYYKAPDLLGPEIAGSLGIPYVIVEASYAPKRADGPWSDWLAAARNGIERADAIFNFTERDRPALAQICDPGRLFDLAPFIDLDTVVGGVRPVSYRDSDQPIRLVTVAMMRDGDKLHSYRLLADALSRLPAENWHLDIVGDGDARRDVEALMSGFSTERCKLHGRLDGSDLHHVLQSGDVFVWPGINEAVGMVYLEAQAFGLPVVAVRTAGVPEVVHHMETGVLADTATPDAFAHCLTKLIDDRLLRERLGVGARSSVEANHSLAAASIRLNDVLRDLVAGNEIANDFG